MPVSQPNVTLNVLPAQTLVPLTEERVLLVGQQTSVATATSGVIVNNIQNDSSENTLFGENSMIAAMVRGFKSINKETQLDVLPLDDDGSAVDATGTITFLGTSTISDTITVTIGSSINHEFEIAVVSGDTETTVAAKLVAAVTVDTKVPMTAGNVAGLVTLTAVNGGTEANSFTLKSTAGTVGQITISVLTPISGGATDPVTTGVLDTAVGTERYQTIVAPGAYTTSFLTSFLDPRQNVTNDILDGVGITGMTDTFANLSVDGLAENSRSLVMFGNRQVSETLYEGSALLEINYVISSKFAAIRSLRYTEGANLAQFNTTNASRDSFGGKEIATLPYHNTLITGLPIIDQDKEFSQIETKSLQDDGLALMGNNRGRTAIILDAIPTTRKTDNAGNPELTFHFLNAEDAASKVREFFVLNNKKRFAQSRLTDGDPQDGRDLVNENQIRSAQLEFYKELEPTLLRGGLVAQRFFNDNMIITLDLLTGLVTLDMTMPFVSQLRIIQGSIIVSFEALPA